MPIKDFVLIYIFPFFFSWFTFCKMFLAARPDFVEKHGWLAYQPFTFIVIILTLFYAQIIKIGMKMRNKEISVWEGRKRCIIVSLKLVVIIIVGASFYLVVLDGKPNLFICL